MYYFAYASNLNRSQMAERCPSAVPRFTADLPNHKLIFTGYSRLRAGATATVIGAKGSMVRGAVYEVSAAGMLKLDKHEGVPELYRRHNVIVYTESGQRIEAVTYIKARQEEEDRPSDQYVAVIRQGYRDWQIE
jgi:gamma-glutamylcyclotransferase